MVSSVFNINKHIEYSENFDEKCKNNIQHKDTVFVPLFVYMSKYTVNPFVKTGGRNKWTMVILKKMYYILLYSKNLIYINNDTHILFLFVFHTRFTCETYILYPSNIRSRHGSLSVQ